jgi:glutamate/tyrosine decarboxylase-like PLP-dependent enzyme
LKIGYKGYKNRAEKLIIAADTFRKAINEIPELELIGKNNELMCVPFKAKNP